MELMDLTSLAQSGIAGVAIAAIGGLIYIVARVLKLVGNHISHNTKALTELAEAVKVLKDFLRNGK